MTDQLKIGFGALEGTIAQQLKKQKLLFDKETAKDFEQTKVRVLHLRFGGYLTDKQYNCIQKKLFKKIVSHVRKLNKPKV